MRNLRGMDDNFQCKHDRYVRNHGRLPNLDDLMPHKLPARKRSCGCGDGGKQ